MAGAASAALSVRDCDVGYEPGHGRAKPGMAGLSKSAAQRLTEAIDVVAWMAEQTQQLAGGEKELAMAETLAAAFEYMVEYLHHASIGRCEPWDALVKAAAGPTDLTPAQVDFLRLAARNRSKMLTAVAGSQHGR